MYPINVELSESHIIDFAFVRSFVPFYKNTGALKKYKALLLSGVCLRVCGPGLHVPHLLATSHGDDT